MDPKDLTILTEIKATVDENNQLLKKLVKQGKIALWTRISYWVFIILLTVGAFALIRPMMNNLKNIYAPAGFSESFKALGGTNLFDELKTQLMFLE